MNDEKKVKMFFFFGLNKIPIREGGGGSAGKNKKEQILEILKK